MIGIITDSTCDIPEALLEQYGIIVVPSAVVWGDRQYRDRIDMKPEEFYRRLVQEAEHPTTSIPTAQDFEQAYNRAIEQGAEALVVLTVSSAMSGIYQQAMNTAPRERVPVEVIDSKGPTMSLGWQVLAAARAREAGASLHEIVDTVARVRSRMSQLVCMDTLEYLKRGGRIGQAMKWMGVMLQVKPVVSINHENGLVEPVGLARTHNGAVEMLFSKFKGILEHMSGLHIAVLHGNAAAEAAQLAERVQRELNPVELLINITGPVLGCNTGPGALALCGYGEGQAA